MASDHALDELGYRLPMEAEWEFACRSGSTAIRFCGASETLLNESGWYVRNSNERVWPIGRLKPNRFGLFDIYGNVQEWCHDAFTPYPVKALEKELTLLDLQFDRNARALRGGGLYDEPRRVRSAYRERDLPGYRADYIGFRIARTVKGT